MNPNEGQMRAPTEAEKKRLAECQEALKAVVDKYSAQLVPQITLGPGGVMAAKVGVMLNPEPQRILVPEIKGGNNVQKL